MELGTNVWLAGLSSNKTKNKKAKNMKTYTTELTLQGKEFASRPTIKVTGEGLSRDPKDYSPELWEALVKNAENQLKIGALQRFILADLRKAILEGLPADASAEAKKKAVTDGMPQAWSACEGCEFGMMDVLKATLKEEKPDKVIKARLAEIKAQVAGMASMLDLLDEAGKAVLKAKLTELASEEKELISKLEETKA